MPPKKTTTVKTTTYNPLYKRTKRVSSTGAPMRKPRTKYTRVYKKAPYKRRLTVPRKVPTIYNKYQSLETFQAYQAVPATKLNNLTNLVWYDATGPTNFNMNGVFGGSASQYTALYGAFRYRRLVSLTIRLVPETWSSSTLQTGGVAPFLIDGEKPKIHWVNDDGRFAQNIALDPTGSVIATTTIADAEKAGRNVVHEALFVKPFLFKIKCYSANTIPPEDSTNLGSQPDVYRSYSKWNRNAQLQLPFANFFYGFSNVPADFKYRVQMFYTIGFKETV